MHLIRRSFPSFLSNSDRRSLGFIKKHKVSLNKSLQIVIISWQRRQKFSCSFVSVLQGVKDGPGTEAMFYDL